MPPQNAGARSNGTYQPNPTSVLVVMLFSALLLSTIGCNQSLQAGAASPSSKTTSSPYHIIQADPPGSEVMVLRPLRPTVKSGGTVQFTAALTSDGDPAVVWWASAGAISKTGLFSAPIVSAPQVVMVSALSQVSSAAHATTLILVSPISQAPLTITSLSVPAAMAETPYSISLSATGGTSPYSWEIVSGSLPIGLQLDSTTGAISGTATQTGTFPLTTQVTDSASNSTSAALQVSVAPATSSNSGNNFDGPAELPRIYLQMTLADTPAPGSTVAVTDSASFQNALNNANCGDTIELQAGASFSGPFVLPAKPCDDQHWIIVRTSAPDASLPAEGTRLTPCYAGVSSLPGRPALNCPSTQRWLPQISLIQNATASPLQLASGANHYRLLGLEVTRPVGTGFIGALISVQWQGTADHVVIDRSWIHGVPGDETMDGVSLRGLTNASVVDSYLNDFHCTAIVGTCTDAHAISGGLGNTPGGPYQIVDNFLEASGEGILFGGGPATTTPADIEIRRNHFFKPLLWMTGTPGFMGGASNQPFIVKNHFELKNAQRVLFEGNILENCWGGFSQNGFSILLTPKNQYELKANSYVCPLCQVTDVTIRYSTISHAGGGIAMATARSAGPNGAMALAGGRYSIHDVTLDDLNGSHYRGGGGLMEILNGWAKNVLNSITVDHITGFPDPQSHILSVGNNPSNPQMWGFTYTNNIVLIPRFPVWAALGKPDCASQDTPALSLASCFSNYTFTHNVLIAVPANYPPSSWPDGNYFPQDLTAIPFVSFNGGNGGDYHLQPSSPYRSAGTDGKDLGADITAIQTITSGVY